MLRLIRGNGGVWFFRDTQDNSCFKLPKLPATFLIRRNVNQSTSRENKFMNGILTI